MRNLTNNEKIILRLAKEKYGASDRDELSFLEDGSATFQVWGDDGDGPWMHISNIASFLEDGLLDESEMKETQM